ncbi:MAG: hypothetical protein V4490_06535 [Pseudomonadota bacterium]
MAKIYGQLEVAQAENLASDPASTASGYLYFNTVSLFIKYYNGSAWKSVVDTDSAQVLTAKKYLGGTASATDVFVDSKDTLVNLTALPRIQAAHYYDTTNNAMVYDDGTSLIAIAAAVDASPTQTGNVNTVQQSFGGLKKFEGGLADTALINPSGAATITLTDADRRIQSFSGVGALITIVLPTTNIKAGEPWSFYMNGGQLSFQASDTSPLTQATINSGADPNIVGDEGSVVLVPIIDTPVTASDWRVLSVYERGIWAGSPSGALLGGVPATLHEGQFSRNDTQVIARGRFSSAEAAQLTVTSGQVTLPHASQNFTTSDQLRGSALFNGAPSGAERVLLFMVDIFAGTGGTSNSVVFSVQNQNATGTISIGFEFILYYDLKV